MINLPDWLENQGFGGNTGTSIAPTKEEVVGFNKYIEAYKKGIRDRENGSIRESIKKRQPTDYNPSIVKRINN